MGIDGRGVVTVLATLLLLAGIVAERRLYRSPSPDTDAYHARIRSAARQMPLSMDGWLGVELPEPPGAVTLLKPNVVVSRRFEHMQSGRSFCFLLVQCRDARDMLGHFPPACYVAHGWEQESAEPADWRIDEQFTIRGTTYVFATARNADRPAPQRMTVENFMILPDGSTGRGMDDVERAARHGRMKHLGAAQVQLMFDLSYTAEERAGLIEMVVRANRDLIDDIRRGVTP
jgi:hypothetical protein